MVLITIRQRLCTCPAVLRAPILFLVLLSCSSNTDNESLKENTRTEAFNEMVDTSTTFWQLDFDTTKATITVPIDNDSYLLKIATYSLNDSSIIWINSLNKGKIYKEVYHNYESLIRLIHHDEAVLDITLDKQTFKDSLSHEFYDRSVIWNIEYNSVRSNRLYFTVDLLVPDTDWMAKGEMAVFYRTSKKGQIDFWGFEES